MKKLLLFGGMAVALALAQTKIPPSQMKGTRYTVTFTSATTVTVTGSTHKLGTADIAVTCYSADTPPVVVEPDWTVDPNSYDVTIKFVVPQSGKCVLR